MATCSRCQGDGEVWEEEEGHPRGGVYDVCYHCGGEGKVDEETDFHDALQRVASSLAYQAETNYRRAVNSDPDGDGYDLGAYENQMMPHDYFRCRVWEREPEIAEKLFAMSRQDQELLIAWNEMPFEPMPKVEAKPQPPIHCAQSTIIEADDNIPF